MSIMGMRSVRVWGKEVLGAGLVEGIRGWPPCDIRVGRRRSRRWPMRWVVH